MLERKREREGGRQRERERGSQREIGRKRESEREKMTEGCGDLVTVTQITREW